MKILHRVFLIIIAVSFCSPLNAKAQSYKPISGGSVYLCGHLPNGTTKIFQQVGRSKVSVAYGTATKVVAKTRSQLRSRLQTLQGLRQHVQENGEIFNGSQLVTFAKAYKDINNGKAVKLPKTNSEKLKLLDSSIQKTTLKFQLKQTELDNLKVCHENKALPFSIDWDVQRILQNGETFVFLLLHIPENEPSTLCVRRNVDPLGSSTQQYFTKDPCANFACPQLVPAHELGDIIYEGREGGSDEDTINQAINEITARAAGGYTGIAITDCSKY